MRSHDHKPRPLWGKISFYAQDDSCSPAAVDALSVTISECSADVASWMRSNRLQLHSDKTDISYVVYYIRTDVNINFPLPLCRSMECLLTLCRLFATWVSTLMLTVTRLDYGNAVLTGLPVYLSTFLSAVGLERRRAADLRLTTLRPCVRGADQPTLAAHSAAYPV